YTHTYLLEEYLRTQNPEYLEITNFTFYQQYTKLSELKTNYRLFDHVEGGFHRYSTRRDWTIPHYEKLLKDQARLLEAYSLLANITNDKIVRDAVTFSFGFLQNKFLDSETGAFYNSQDAYIEDEYFGKTAEERALIEPPHIDKTLFSDSNAQIIIALISASHFLKNSTYRGLAKAVLDFFAKNMVSDKNGAYFYFDFDKKEAEITGQSFANSWLLLAFVRGYEEFNDSAYLSAAEKLGLFSLSNLYDWNSGGFFERHSAEDELYGHNQRILLSKPYEENAVFAYGMLKLYTLTGKLVYLNAGLKTFGYFEDSFGGLDESYYFVKSAQVIKESNLVADYLGRSSEVSLLEKRGKENFFLPGLLEAQKAGKPLPSVSFVAPSLEDRQFTNANFAALALLAFLVGLVSFLSPCTLPILPAFFASAVESGRAAHTSGATGANPSKHKKTGIAANTLLFIAGLSVVFAVFGMGATLFGSVLREHRVLFSAAAGVVVIMLGLMQILGKGFSGFRLFSGKAPGRAGFVFFGMAFGLGWSACIGPVLASLLLLAASSSTVIKGMLLLFIYISGLALPLLLLSLAFERIKNQKLWQLLNGSPVTITLFNKKIETHTTYILSGFLLIIIGFLIFNGYLYSLNKFALSTGYVQKIVIGAEEWLKSVFL
ncbi:hypothetical protein HYV85_06885, partial [Candidatus Woesearchaeota archaeon]|nr:hypothetical protein [Candidatus Woesearchaeota archaeon]